MENERGIQLITLKAKYGSIKHYALSYSMAVVKLLQLAYAVEAGEHFIDVEMRPLAEFARDHEIVRLA